MKSSLILSLLIFISISTNAFAATPVSSAIFSLAAQENCGVSSMIFSGALPLSGVALSTVAIFPATATPATVTGFISILANQPLNVSLGSIQTSNVCAASLTFTSTNNGSLVNGTSSIPYQLTMNGTPVSFSSSNLAQPGSKILNISSPGVPSTITGGVPYTDQITVSFSLN